MLGMCEGYQRQKTAIKAEQIHVMQRHGAVASLSISAQEVEERHEIQNEASSRKLTWHKQQTLRASYMWYLTMRFGRIYRLRPKRKMNASKTSGAVS